MYRLMQARAEQRVFKKMAYEIRKLTERADCFSYEDDSYIRLSDVLNILQENAPMEIPLLDSDSNHVEKEKYYDVVCSVYEEKGTNNCCDVRVDSHLICGGFQTEDDAMEYINNNDCSKYDSCCSNGEYPCIEIEEHNEDGSVASVITVD